MQIDKSKYIWALDKGKYGLLEIEKGTYLVYDIIDESVVLIEDDEEGDFTIKEMLKNGNEIIPIEVLNRGSK